MDKTEVKRMEEDLARCGNYLADLILEEKGKLL